jgi:hypothetical protein
MPRIAASGTDPKVGNFTNHLTIPMSLHEHFFSRRSSMKRILALGVLLSSLALPSCIGIGGTVNTQRPTTGQELIDLKAALDKGVINQAEYDQKKSQILAAK